MTKPDFSAKKPMAYRKREVAKDVLTLALERINYAYDLFDTIAVSFSGGKDSVTGDAKVWVKVDGALVYTTIAALVDDYVTIRNVETQDDGSMIIYPANRIEIPSSTSTGQIDAKIEFFPISWFKVHEVEGPLYRFTLTGGNTITVTGDHSVMVAKPDLVDGKHQVVVKPMKSHQVSVGDSMFVMRSIHEDTPDADVPDWMLRLAGLWVADGCTVVGRKVVISTGNYAPVVEFLSHLPRERTRTELALTMFEEVRGRYQTQEAAILSVAAELKVSRSAVVNAIYKGPVYTHEYIRPVLKENGDLWLHSKPLVEELERLGFVGDCYTKRVPPWLFTASKRQIGLFLAGYFDGDGCVTKKCIEISSVNVELLKDVKALLSRIGVFSALFRGPEKAGGFANGKRGWRLSISRNYCLSMMETWVPLFKGYSKLDIKFATQDSHDYDVRGAMVKSIELVDGPETVYDFEVPGNHMFIANDILVHNSTVALNLTLQVAHERNRLPLYVFHFDEEAIPYEIEHYVRRVYNRPDVDLKWWCVPVSHTNACSGEEGKWITWNPEERHLWVRPMPPEALTKYPNYDPTRQIYGIPEIAAGQFDPATYGRVGVMMGIRAAESLTRQQAVSRRSHENFIVQEWAKGDDFGGSKLAMGNTWKVYPIYDWQTSDVWTAPEKMGWDYSAAYDLMEMAGIPHHSQRIAPPFGTQPSRSLWMFKECFPDIWGKLQHRVPGANTAALYANTELYAEGKIVKPEHLTWEAYIKQLLDEIPDLTTRGYIANIIRKNTTTHIKKTENAPILPYVPHPNSGLTWEALAKMVIRRDNKQRLRPDMKMVSIRNPVAFQRAMDKYNQALADYEAELAGANAEHGRY